MKRFVLFLTFVLLPLLQCFSVRADNSCEKKLKQEVELIISDKATSENLDILKDSYTERIKNSYAKELQEYLENNDDAFELVNDGVDVQEVVLGEFAHDLAKLYCTDETQVNTQNTGSTGGAEALLRADAEKIVNAYQKQLDALNKKSGNRK